MFVPNGGEGGALLPPEVLAGQARAVVHNGSGEMHKLAGEAIQIEGQGPDPSYLTMIPLSLTGNVGTSQQIYPTIHWADGTSFINQNPSAIDWYPGNSSVATVSEAWSNFQVQFQGPGSTQMDAKMPNECHYEWNHFVSECDCPYYPVAAAQVPAQVTTSCAIPVSFRTKSVSEPSDGSLVFNYEWSSSTGNQSDLSACTVGETVFYPGSQNPFSWPLPMVQSTTNPTVITGLGSNAGFIDTNGSPNSYRSPYFANSFQATQRLWWSCPCHENGGNQLFVPDIAINRRIFRDADGLWNYEITKSGRTSRVVLPNQ